LTFKKIQKLTYSFSFSGQWLQPTKNTREQYKKWLKNFMKKDIKDTLHDMNFRLMINLKKQLIKLFLLVINVAFNLNLSFAL